MNNNVWVLCNLIFSIVWGLCGTINSKIRFNLKYVSDKICNIILFFIDIGKKRFDVFFRKLIDGSNEEFPRPTNFKLSKNQLFPEKGLIFDYVFDKKNGGSWISWIEIEKDHSMSENLRVLESKI